MRMDEEYVVVAPVAGVRLCFAPLFGGGMVVGLAECVLG